MLFCTSAATITRPCQHTCSCFIREQDSLVLLFATCAYLHNPIPTTHMVICTFLPDHSVRTCITALHQYLQELVKYLGLDAHLEGHTASPASQPPNLDQLISLLQRSQVCPLDFTWCYTPVLACASSAVAACMQSNDTASIVTIIAGLYQYH